MTDSNRVKDDRWGRPQKRRSRGMKSQPAPSESGFLGPVDESAIAEGVPTLVRAVRPAAEMPPPMVRQNRDADDIDRQLQELVAHMARGIVDHAQDVHVDILHPGDDASLELSVHPDDLGHVIGKQGRTARSLRLALGAAAARHGRKAGLEIAD